MVKIYLDFRNVILYKYCYFKLWLLKKNNNKFSRTFCVNPCSGEIVLWWYLYGVPWWLQLSKFLLSTTNLYGHKYQCFTILHNRNHLIPGAGHELYWETEMKTGYWYQQSVADLRYWLLLPLAPCLYPLLYGL